MYFIANFSFHEETVVCSSIVTLLYRFYGTNATKDCIAPQLFCPYLQQKMFFPAYTFCHFGKVSAHSCNTFSGFPLFFTKLTGYKKEKQLLLLKLLICIAGIQRKPMFR
jgi:hypothetical protein